MSRDSAEDLLVSGAHLEWISAGHELGQARADRKVKEQEWRKAVDRERAAETRISALAERMTK